MKKEELIQKAYEIAVERYAAVGVDTEQVLKTMQDFHLSLHCWQADDVAGFEVQAGSLTGGIQATGNYPGKARNIDELRADILKAASYIPGTHRLNLHEIYGDFQGKVVDRDQVEPEHFKSWIEWGKEHNMKLISTLPLSLIRNLVTCHFLILMKVSVNSGLNIPNAVVPLRKKWVRHRGIRVS